MHPTEPTPHDQAQRRILDRARRCATASAASSRLFLRRIAEETIRNPHAGQEDASAARALIDLLQSAPGEADRLLGTREAQLPLFAGEGGAG
jgi:hypothetical protein